MNALRAGTRVRWLLVLLLLPALVGAGAGFAFDRGLLPGEETFFVFRLQAPAGLAVAVVGVLLSGLGLLAWWGWWRWQTALARASAHERQAQIEAHRRFVRRLDHELKNPLTAVRAALINVAEQAEPTGGLPSSLQTAQRQVERLSKLAGDLRKLADLEARDLEQTGVDVEGLVQEVVELACAAPGREGRSVSVSVQRVPWRPGPLTGDRDLLLLALYNLLDNALKFSPPSAAVEVRAREDGAGTTLEVADTGPGIAPDDLPHVTEELYRGHGAQGVEGSGLGLALVERVAALHGGRLALRSRLGQGTVATLWLPAGRA